MSDIKLIANYLNTTLQAGAFKGAIFKRGKFYGIVDYVLKTNEEPDNEYLIPLVLDTDGIDGQEVIINDTYPFQLYHKINSQKTEDAEKEDTFGDGIEKSVIFEMSLIIFADRFITSLDANDFITSLMLSLPKILKPSLIIGSQFNKCEITTKDCSSNVKEILTEEYGGKDFNIKQSYVALKFNYDVRLTYTDGCYTLC